MKIKIKLNHLFYSFLNICILFVGFFAGYKLWGSFELPFQNKYQVMGPLVLQKYNPSNGILYFLIFISIPSVLLSLLMLINKLREKKIAGNDLIFKTYSFSFPGGKILDDLCGFCHRKYKWIYFLHFVILILFSLTGLFYLLSLDFIYFPMDIFHEGESLTPAWKYLQTGELWKGSFFIHGVFYDPLTSAVGWKLFNQISVGAYRIFALFMSNIVVLPLGILFALTAKFMDPGKKMIRKVLLAQILILIFYFTEPQKGFLPLHFLERRDLFVLIGLCFLITGIGLKKALWFFLAGLFSALCYAYAIDRGAYFSALLAAILILIFLFPLAKNKKQNQRLMAALAAGIVFGWILFVIVFGIDETSHFLKDTITIYQIKDLFDSYRFSENPYYKIPMVFIGIQLFFFVLYFWKYYLPGRAGRNQFYIHFMFTFLSIIYFRSAFGRGDITHLFYASSFACYGLAMVFWNSLRRLNYRWIVLFSIVLVFTNLQLTRSRYRSYNVSRIVSFWNRASEYAAYPDEKYLSPELYSSIKKLKELFDGQPGIMDYSSDAGLAYLLRKTHYGKNYIVWFSSSLDRRKELRDDFEKYNPELVIVKGINQCYDGICNDKRFPELDPWIMDHYKPYKVFGPWEVYRRK